MVLLISSKIERLKIPPKVLVFVQKVSLTAYLAYL